MNIINTFKDTVRLEICKRYLEQLFSYEELGRIDGEYILASQLEYVKDNCLLGLIVDRVCTVLDGKIPHVLIDREDRVVEIERLPIFDIIDDIDSNFFAYLHKTSIEKIKVSTHNHLSKTLNAIKERYPEFYKLDFSQHIGIELRGYTKENKHVGKIDLLLKAKGYKIFYFNETKFAYQNSRERIKNSWVMVANSVYFAYLTNVKVLYLTSTPVPIQDISRLKTKILHIGHNFNEAIFYTAWRREEEHFYNSLFVGRIDRSHYILTSTKNEYLLCKKTFEKYGLDTERIVKAGNPSMDYALEKYEDIREEKNKSQNLIVAPSHFSSISENKAISKMLTDLICDGGGGINVVLRLHPFYYDREKDSALILEWKKCPNFIFDTSKSYFNEYLANSFALLTEESSMGQSYPYIFLKPSIYFYLNPLQKGIDIDGICSYDSNLGFSSVDAQKIKKFILEIANNKDIQEKYKESIGKYRESQIYNLRRSSEYIVEFIEHLMGR